jgi:type IV secretion/conjugal transfer VirB4 family ATPase
MRREFRSKKQGLIDLINYAALIDEGVCLLKDGSLLAVFAYRGHDLDSAGAKTLEFLSAHINQILCQLGDGWMIHVDMVRFPSLSYPNVDDCHFPDATSQLIDEERCAQYSQEDSHFESRYMLTLTYQTPTETESRLQNWLVQSNQGKAKLNNQVIIYFLDNLDKIESALSNYLNIIRLSSQELITYLHNCVTGLSHLLAVPRIPVYLSSLLASQDFIGGLQPKIGDKYIKVISISGLPLESEPGLLSLFEQIPLSFRWSNRFIFLDPNTAHKELSIFRRNWFQKRHGMMGILREVFNSSSGAGFQNRDALEMTEDADTAISEADSNLVRFGYYTSVVVIFDEDIQRINESAKFVLKQLNLRGFTGRVETLNAIESYLGSLPGHGYENIRKPIIHTLNLTDLLPLTSVWAGLQTNPCKYYPVESPPLLHAKTIGNTPFRLNLHVSDVAHTLIKGMTGAGKSTFVLLLVAQFFRYLNAQVFLFDKGYSSYPLTKAMIGNFYDIGGEKNELSFYPLQNIHEISELEWACGWIEVLIECQMITITSEIRKEIRESLVRLQQHPENKRTLTDFQGTVQHAEIKASLQYYTLGGALGHILDADHDSLREGRLQVFEIQHLLQQGHAYTKPVLLYLFHQIDKRLTKGHPSLIVIEEGHSVLDGQFGEQLETWLLEKRKQNTGIVFIDQSLAKIMQSRFAHTLIDSCQTKIFLPDKDSDSSLNEPLYQAAGLNEREIEIIKHSHPKQHYFYTSSLGKRLIDLGLGEVALSFLGVDSVNDRKFVDKLMTDFGDQWVYQWLKHRGLSKWADRWLEIYEEKNANK